MLLANWPLVIAALFDKFVVVNPVAEIVPDAIEIPEPAVSAPCLALKVVKSVLVSKPVTLLEAVGILCSLADVNRPFVSTVILGTEVELP